MKYGRVGRKRHRRANNCHRGKKEGKCYMRFAPLTCPECNEQLLKIAYEMWGDLRFNAEDGQYEIEPLRELEFICPPCGARLDLSEYQSVRLTESQPGAAVPHSSQLNRSTNRLTGSSADSHDG